MGETLQVQGGTSFVSVSFNLNQILFLTDKRPREASMPESTQRLTVRKDHVAVPIFVHESNSVHCKIYFMHLLCAIGIQSDAVLYNLV